MYFVDNKNNTDPRVNLAIEEYLVKNILLNEDILLFYINGPSIIIGRNQNTIEEINADYVHANNIHVVRRLSGGGAVYHDLGNLNFSFIAPNNEGNFTNFQKFTAPVISVLKELGVKAELSGRNDILVAERKISGNAQYNAGKRMVSHGTLLFDTDLSKVADALQVKSSKIESKGIKSVRGRVANINEFLEDHISITEFRNALLAHLFSGKDVVQTYVLTPKDWIAINQLSKDRYQSWDWNYGRSPAFNIQKIKRFPGGEIDARITVEKGLIKSIKFYGDFFCSRELEELETILTNVRYQPVEISDCLEKVDISAFFANVSREELVKLLY